MDVVRDTIYFEIEYFDGQEEGDVGYPYYVAHSDELHATTDAQSLDELFANIQEVVALALEGENTIAEFNVVPNPRVVITFEMPQYAATA